jgi:predicted ATPase
VLECHCANVHNPRRVVLTGGPGAGKTATLGMVRQSVCKHVHILPEAASIVYGGGFPRTSSVEGIKAVQRAIFAVQRELEAAAAAEHPAVMLSDRGTVDGHAYWPGPDDFFHALDTTSAQEFSRYHTVIHLRTPPGDAGYDHSNRLRVESAAEAAVLDLRILDAWAGHPHRFVIDASTDFVTKATHVIELIRAELPACCHDHVIVP